MFGFKRRGSQATLPTDRGEGTVGHVDPAPAGAHDAPQGLLAEDPAAEEAAGSATPSALMAERDPDPPATPSPRPGEGEPSAEQRAEEELRRARAREMNLVQGGLLTRALDGALRETLREQFGELPEERLAALSAGVRKRLVVTLKAGSKRVRGLPKAHFLREVVEDRRRIEAQKEAARAELEKLLVQLGQKRAEYQERRAQLVRESFDHGLEQDQEVTELIHRAFGEALTPEQRETRDRVTSLVLESLARERQRALEEKTAQHREEVRRFELRLAKLSQSLEVTEEELRRIAAMKNIDPGIASIYRTVQGLSPDDENAEAKREMLAGIFEANLKLQKGGEGTPAEGAD